MEKELDIKQLFSILWQNKWFILIMGVICGSLVWLFSTFVITPQYSSSVSMYVYNDSRPNNAISSSDLLTAQKLVDTYIVILTSDSVLNKVSEQLGGGYSSAQLREMLQAASINNTEAFKITATHSNLRFAQKLANTVAEIAPAEIIRVVKAGAVEVIDKATVPVKPSSPNVKINSAIGVLLGLILAIFFCLLKNMFDTVINSEEDLKEVFNIPILGVIPRLVETQTAAKESDNV